MENNLLIGYARVSSVKQSLDIQVQQLKDYAAERGCEIEVYSETLSVRGKKIDSNYPLATTRPILAEAINSAKAHNCPLVVTYADRLARTMVIGRKIVSEYPNIKIIFGSGDILEDIRKAEADNIFRSQKTKNALSVKKQEICDNIYDAFGDYAHIWRKATYFSEKFKIMKSCFQETMIEDAIDDFCFGGDELANGISKSDCDRVVSYIIDGMVQDKKYQKTLHDYIADNSKREAEIIPLIMDCINAADSLSRAIRNN